MLRHDNPGYFRIDQVVSG